MTKINTSKSINANVTGNYATSITVTPSDRQNLNRYVHVVWAIYQRRRTESIDRKSNSR